MNYSIKNVDTFLLDQFDQTDWKRGGVWFSWKTSSCREPKYLSVWRSLILVIASLGGLDNVGLCLSHYSRYVHMGNWLQTLKMCPYYIFRLTQSCLTTVEIQHFQNPVIFCERYTSLGLTRHFLLRGPCQNFVIRTENCFLPNLQALFPCGTGMAELQVGQ
jgi:hypothetical protein